jgi:hypothetical protein
MADITCTKEDIVKAFATHVLKDMNRQEFIHNDKKCMALRTPRDGGYIIKVEIPDGCTIDDLNLQVSFGRGYLDMELN